MLTNKSNPPPLVCPYNPAHVMLKDRVQKHLVKCRRNYPDAKRVPCIYNVTHQVPEPELNYHLEECNDRIAVDKHTFIPETITDRYPIPPPAVRHAEVWDDEEVPSYDPAEHCKKNPIIRNAATVTKPAAEKRQFRMEERKRMQEFSANVDPVPNTAPQQIRRPVTESAGMVNTKELTENEPLLVAKLLKEVESRSRVLVTPASTFPNDLRPGTPATMNNKSSLTNTVRGRGRGRLV